MVMTCVLLGNGVSDLQGSMFRASVADDFKRALSFAEFVFEFVLCEFPFIHS